jgi:hypothetical protein
MSAFVIEKKEYRKLAVVFNYLYSGDVYANEDKIEEWAKDFYNTNVEAVNYRYKDNMAIEDWKPISRDEKEAILSVIRKKSYSRHTLEARVYDFIQCAAYQCSEGKECTFNALRLAKCFYSVTLRRAYSDVEVKQFGILDL